MAFNRPPVANSEDFQRVLHLPVRAADSYPADLVQQLTHLLKTPEGTQTLFDVQARALYDFGQGGKGAFPIKVGGGKTLITFLLPRLMGAKRPVLITRASLLEKTEREWRKDAEHWRVAKNLRFASFEYLGRSGKGAIFLDTIMPDLIIVDESHKLKNPRAAVTRRFMRHMRKHPEVTFVWLGGSLIKNGIKDFAHLMEWSHGKSAPLPLDHSTLDAWAGALDEGKNVLERRSPGVLLDLYPWAPDVPDSDDVDDDFKRARRRFFARMNATQGVVIADDKNSFTGSLEIDAVEYTVNAATEKNFQTLRQDKCRPDGWALAEAIQEWAVARQLALGIHYAWRVTPPQEWLDCRKAWAKFVRDYLTNPRSQRQEIDSEFQVMTGVLAGKIQDDYNTLKDWRAIKPTYEIESVPVWHDDAALNLCSDWLDNHPKGICWVEHRFFGHELSRRTGIPYFAAKGLDPQGNFIEDHDGPIIASVAANTEGRNLQFKWSDNLITAPWADSERWEQVIARTHRIHQIEDSVQVDVLFGCREHAESIPRALASADVKKDLIGFEQKLRVADINWIDDAHRRVGFRWV